LKDASKLQDEYAKLVEGLQEADEARDEELFMANPGLHPWSTIESA
jgi:DNA excision repair protein ERCC-2